MLKVLRRKQKSFFAGSALPLLSVLCLIGSTQTASALWSGSKSSSSSFTTLIKIGGQKQLDCSGVLIAPRLVLTAGHCMHGARSVSVHIGGENIAVENWLVNPSWSAGLPANGWDARINASNSDNYIDLAVLLLQKAPQNAHAIDLTGSGAPAEQSALKTYGYARGRMLEPLYKVDSTSASYVRRLSPTGPFKFFASGGSAWCQGDSGGPVTRYENGSEKLVGIVGLGLGAIAHDPNSAVAMRWGGTDRVPKCGSYSYVQDVHLHAGWIAEASASLTGDVPYTSSVKSASRVSNDHSAWQDRR
ncbi:MAG: trypsin-like serine protease [Pseudomonadota bacterium]